MVKAESHQTRGVQFSLDQRNRQGSCCGACTRGASGVGDTRTLQVRALRKAEALSSCSTA